MYTRQKDEKTAEKSKLFSAKMFADELYPIMEIVQSLLERTGFMTDGVANLKPMQMELDKNSPESIFRYEEATKILTSLYNAWIEAEIIRPSAHCGTIYLDKRTAQYKVEMDDGETKELVPSVPMEILIPIDLTVTPAQYKWVRTCIAVERTQCGEAELVSYYPRDYPYVGLNGLRVRYRVGGF